MSIQISEITNKDEFAEVVKVEHLAYDKPYNAFWEALKGPNVEEMTERQWAWHEGTPGSHWIKATKDGKVVGAAEWVIHEKNPFETPGPAVKATWWPEGSHLKSVSDHMMNTFFSGRPGIMNRPHFLVNICFVHPDYRRQGVGRLLMEWGCKQADEKGLESFVESTTDGRELYKSAGFVIVHPFYLDAQPSAEEEKDPEWLKVKKQITPEPYAVWLMWRPAGGKFEEGKTKYSWES